MKSSKMLWIIVSLTLMHNACEVHAYAKGAPATSEICEKMLPHHGADPQSAPSPYRILLDRKTARPGQGIRVTIKVQDPDDSYVGFLIMGKPVSERDQKASEGIFALNGDIFNNAKLINCFGVRGSAITHTNNNPKKQITFKWIAPAQEGQYVLVGTIVKSFNIFWANVQSTQVTIKK